MNSKSVSRGKTTSLAEVENISARGFWLSLRGEEFFLSFEQFPWFRHATVDQILQVTLPSANHLYWPSLDIDLAVESIRNPSAFPLLAARRT